MSPRRLFPMLLIGLLIITAPGSALAQDGGPDQLGGPAVPAALAGTGFTYQGSLSSGSSPVDANCDFQFSLHDAVSGGAQLGITQPFTGTTVTAGRFTVVLNESDQFGPQAFDGSARWLAVAVRCPTLVGGFTNLTPRQALLPAPLAFALPGLRTEFSGLASPNVIGGHISNTVSGALGAVIAGGGGPISGAANTVAAGWAVVGGGWGNSIPVTGTFATVSGGRSNIASSNYAALGGGYQNTVSGDRASVGGGWSNTAGGYAATVAGGALNSASGAGATVGGGGWDDSSTAGNAAAGHASTVGGGWGNTIPVTGTYATVSGGQSNSAAGVASAIGGGGSNTIPATGSYAVVGGGALNLASGDRAVVGGGGSNTASSQFATASGGAGNIASSDYTTAGGGWNNTASGAYATVSGGRLNTASGESATVAGGRLNTASGAYSFAAGFGSNAGYGSFVWTCASCAYTYSSANDQFVANALGGFWLGRGGTGPSGAIDPSHAISTSTGAYLSTAGVWTDVSDRNLKTSFMPVDGVGLLDALMGMPVQSWMYKVDDASVRHIGPTAQDFYAAFGVGADDTHLAALDTSGVALAAIQGLYSVVQEKYAALAEQAERISTLESSNTDLAARVAALEAGGAHGGAPLALPWLLLAGLALLNLGGAAGYWLARRKTKA